MITFYEKTAISGGTGTSLDGIDGAVLNDGDICFVQYGNAFYEYLMTASGYTTNPPYVVVPTANPGTKRWVLQSPYHYSLASYGAGLTYQLTNAQALITGAPSITLAVAGVYLVSASVTVDYVAATFAAVRTMTVNLYRTNNTPGNITNAQAIFKTQIVTTLTYTAGEITLPPVIYTTANLTDVLTLYAGLDTAPTAGSFQVTAGWLTALRIR